MPTKLYCDICGDELPEVSEGEGHDSGLLQFGYGAWQDPNEMYFNLDLICESCTKKIKKSIERIIELIKEEPRSARRD